MKEWTRKHNCSGVLTVLYLHHSAIKMVKGLVERLKDGETVICAEGYLFEFEARGLLKIGAYVPEVVLEHPDLVRELHREFVRAGSDVVLAFTYYAHREKLRLIGREDDLEKMNRQALKIAREVADETGTLMAGNICNSTIFVTGDKATEDKVYKIFEEQIKWAVEGGADFIVGETFETSAEAALAMKAINAFGNGLPGVINMSVHPKGLFDGVSLTDACKRLEGLGAAAVGLNCMRGPESTLALLPEVRAACKGPIAALPVCYRTPVDKPTFQSLDDVDDPSRWAFPINLSPYYNSQTQIANFTKNARDIGVQFLGLCCGNRAHYTRTMAETLGRVTPSSRYTPDMSKHYSSIADTAHRETQGNYAKMYKMDSLKKQ